MTRYVVNFPPLIETRPAAADGHRVLARRGAGRLARGREQRSNAGPRGDDVVGREVRRGEKSVGGRQQVRHVVSRRAEPRPAMRW